MKTRCYNPNCREYRWYGALGIRVCERWRVDFRAFLSDMGERPTDKHQIDRIDPSKDYEPGNCRWVTRAEQRANQRPKSPTHCKYGHEFTPENTTTTVAGTRLCRTCQRARSRKLYVRSRLRPRNDILKRAEAKAALQGIPVHTLLDTLLEQYIAS